MAAGDGELIIVSIMLGIASPVVSDRLATRGGPGESLVVRMGLGLAGLPAGDLGPGNFVGVGRLDSLEVGLCPGRVLGSVRLGDPTMVLGVTGLRACGGLDSIDCSPLRLS